MNHRILALDAATEACSVALWDGRRTYARFEEPGRAHGMRILKMVDGVLAEAGLRLRELDALAAGVGPGAFTGVRISVAVAQGLAYGAGLPVLSVSSLEALAMRALELRPSPDSEVLACLDARMNELYWGLFRSDAARGVAALGAARVSAPDDVPRSMPDRPIFGVGRGMRVLVERGLWSPACAHAALPDAQDMLRLALLRFGLGEAIDVGRLMPVYLRDKVALTERERARGPS